MSCNTYRCSTVLCVARLWELPRHNLIWAFNLLADEWPALSVTDRSASLDSRSVTKVCRYRHTTHVPELGAAVPEEVSVVRNATRKFCADHRNPRNAT